MKSISLFIAAAATLLSFATASPVPADSASEIERRQVDILDINIGLGIGSDGSRGVSRPDRYTSTYTVNATPDQVINNNQTAVPGLRGARGTYRFGINSNTDVICYSITLSGFSQSAGDYSSPARTATHVHQAVRGRAGPPRLAFPNPRGTGSVRNSYGCMQFPFTTGLIVNGVDTGVGFRLKQIEDNPKGFFADVHTSNFLAGAIRGQLA